MINCIIVDDEPLALEVLESHLNQFEDIHISAKCRNAIEANKALEENDIQLMFLDIQMPQITGLEFLRSLQRPPLTILTTAHQEFALEGYELDVVDYLMKPISLDKLMKSINKVKNRLDGSSTNDTYDHFFVKADKKLIKVNYKDIVYIEGLKDYVIIHLEGKRIVTLQTMKHLEAHLKSNRFIRVHRSFIVNINKIQALSGQMLELSVQHTTKLIPIGKNYRDGLIDVINEKRI